MIELFKKYRFALANILVLSFLCLLPYLIFQGKFYIGGDDTRLYYYYPIEYFKNTNFFSWHQFSSIGWNTPTQSFLPFVLMWAILANVIKSHIILGYLAFSLPLVLGFVFFQKLINVLLNKNTERHSVESFLGAIFYIFSPIVVYDQLFIFLNNAWLLALVPIICYYFLSYLQNSNFSNIFKAICWTTFLSLVVLGAPWILGFVLPIFLSLLVSSVLFRRKEILVFLKKSIVFFGCILISQSFWLIAFFMTFINVSSNSYAGKIFSKEALESFSSVVLSTATGNIIYPLLNLFHRQVAFDFGWDLKNTFLTFYDKTYFLNGIFLIVLFLGILNFKKYTNTKEKKMFIVLLSSFVLSLYFFTINIGPLRDIFILFGKIPGFLMFRYFSDKFAFGYAVIYSILLTYCLVILRRKFDNSNKLFLIRIIFFCVILLNLVPIKQILSAPLWETKSTYRNIIIPSEYLEFMKGIADRVTKTNNILSIPFGSASNTVIKEENSNNAYAGISPVIIFSGINDISGHLSFNFTKGAGVVDGLIINRKYDELNKLLYNYNINYVFLTKNVPEEIKSSYLFDPNLVSKQDNEFMSAITDTKILISKKGNYELYTTKKQNVLLQSENLYFQRINRAKYKLLIKNIKKSQDLSFNDSFHDGWRLYLLESSSNFPCTDGINHKEHLTVECKENFSRFEDEELMYLWKKPVFDDNHKLQNGFANKWAIDPDFIKKNFDKRYYKINSDGSLDIKLVMYFKPQSYFYLGVLISLVVDGTCLLYLIKKRK